MDTKNTKTIEGLLIRHEDKTLLFQAALDQSYSSVVITDAGDSVDGPKIIYVNTAFQKMTGYTTDELVGKSPKILQGPLTDQEIIEKMRVCIKTGEHFEDSTINYDKSGTPYNVEWSISPIKDNEGEIQYFISLQKNITAFVQAQDERNQLAQALNDLALKDPLTGMLNRRAGERLLIQYDDHRKHQGETLCLVMLDIDNFKKINDSFGHVVGDEVLKTISRTLQTEARSSDNVIRWGGEEFLIIVPKATLKETSVLTERIRGVISNQIINEVGQVTASFGIAELQEKETTASLVNRADKALYEAKLSGKNCIKTASYRPNSI